MAGAVLGCAGLFYSGVIGPLRVRENELVQRQRELSNELSSTHDLLVGLKDSDQKVAEARAALNRAIGPQSGGALVTFPTEMNEYFSRFSLPPAAVRLATAREERDLPGYNKIYWSIGIPLPKTDRNLEGLLLAIAGLEEQERYLKMTDFAVQADATNPELRMASVSVVVLDRK